MPITTPVQLLPVGYYLNLLTSEYSEASQFKQWLLAVLNIANDTSNLLSFITSAFDLDYAIGAQLDVVGQLEGISRVVQFQPSGGASPVLSDSDYRLLIRATRANNQWDGKMDSLYSIWNQLFPGGNLTILDQQNMTAIIILTGSFSSIIQDMIVNDLIVPRPQAVQYTYDIGGLPFFGFDRDDAFIAGFDVGKWSG